MADEEEVKDLDILSIIAFDGNIPDGLHCHPDGIHFIYPIGNSVTIQNSKTKTQEFLKGHTNSITAVTVSTSGKYIASGQINHMGFKAMVILWDFERRCMINKYEIHKVRVESVAFTCDDSFLISLGGRDDTCVVIYDMKENEPLCGNYANGSSTGNAITVYGLRTKNSCFLTAGDRTLRFWTIDQKKRKTSPTEINFNKIKRLIHCLVMDEKDEILYCGTSTGDIAKVYFGCTRDKELQEPKRQPPSYACPRDKELQEPKREPALIGCFGKYLGKNAKMPTGCSAECYSQGVKALIFLKKGELLVGAGDGLVELVRERDESHINDYAHLRVKDPTIPMLTKIQSQFVDAGVSSMKIWDDVLVVGTVLCEIFTIDMKTWDLKLKSTCHTSAICDICFPSDFSAVFATCSKDTIRVWNTETSQELLRISVPNFTCSGVCFYHNGKGIVSSWNDGTIRCFTPQTGKLMYIIYNAHNKGVSALNITKDGSKIVSGGGEGQVRVWSISPDVQTLKAVLQEHKGPVSALHINNANDEAASASTDGSCIIWDIIRCVRKNIIFANTLFMAVRYHPSDCQILTTGTNRKIAYWETYDGSLIRDLEGSTAAGLNAIDISGDGSYIVSGGNDQLVKLWKYQEGITTHVGLGHAGIITGAKFSPDNNYIITVSADGGIYRWRNPYTMQDNDKEVKEVAEVRSVHSTSCETNKASAADLNECITKTMKVKCKCGKTGCKCPPLKLTTTKACKCTKPRCNCTLTIARPVVKRTQSQEQMRRVIRVPKSEIGKNHIFGDYCPRIQRKKVNGS